MQKAKQPLYLIKSTVMDGQLFIDLNILDDKTATKTVKCFGKSFNDDNLPENVKKNFKDINNVHSILTQNPGTCHVDTKKGHLTLVYEVAFPNGSKFKLQGILELQQKDLPIQKSSTIKGDQLEEKIAKIQQNIKIIQSSFQSESKLHQNIINKVIKDISSDILGLKQKYQQIKNWKNIQQIRYKQLLINCRNHHQQISKTRHNCGGGKITDEVLHIFHQKSDEHKQIFTDRFQKHAQKIQDLKDTTTRHQKYIDKTTQQNIQLKKTVKTLQDRVVKLVEKNELFQEKFNQLYQSHKKAIKVINSQHEQIENVKKQVTTPKKQQKVQLNPLAVFLQTLQQNSGPNRKTTSTNFSMFNVQSPKAQKVQKSQPLSIAEFMQIHPSSRYSKQFINNGKVISYNGVSEQPTQLVGKPKVTSNKCSFVTVSKSKNNQIGIGIIDSRYVQQRNSIKKPNCIVYNANNGALYESGAFITSDGTGFRQGDKVKMKVLVSEGIIDWSIGGISVCKHKSQKIKDNKIQWLPFVRMCDRGDAVKWTIQ